MSMAETEIISDTRSRQPLRRWNSPWAAGTVLFAAYVAVAAGTVLFVQHWVDPSLRVMMIAAPWLAVGVGVVGVLKGGARLWPALFIGSWMVWGVIVGDSAISVTIDAVAEAGSIVLIARLLSAWGFHRSFDRFRDPLILLAAAAVGRILASALDWVGAFAAAWLTPESIALIYRPLLTAASGAYPALTVAMLPASIHWTLNSIAGIMLVVPLISARPDVLLKAYTGRPMSLGILGLALLTWSAAALNLPMAAAQPLLITALMLVAWASVRFGAPAAAFATLTMSLVATAGVGMRVGPLASENPIESIALQWGFISLLVLTGLSLTALLAERSHDLKRLQAAAERYRRLFKANPSPLWVAEPAGGRILMVNDEALRHYGFSEAEFLALSVVQLIAEGAAVPALAPGARAGGAQLLRHRTRDGTVIHVELLSTPIELDGRIAELCYAVDITDRVELRSQILAAADLERGRLVQELHDGLGQVLTGLNFGVQAAAVRASRGAGVDDAFIDFLVDASNHAVELCRQLTRGVSPLQDANGDLLEALRRLPSSLPPDSGPRLKIEVESEAPLNLSLERSEHLYRVVQEAVANALKHAHATLIRVHTVVTPETVRVSIEDDGIGIQYGARPTHGLGMRSMELRAAAVGSSVEVSARAGGGTLIRCECPQAERVPVRPTQEFTTGEPSGAPRVTPMRGNAPAAGRAVISYVGHCLLLAAACFAGLAVTVDLAKVIDPRLGVNGSRLAVPSLLVGLAAAGLILGGGRLWPGIALGTLLGAALLTHQPWLYAVYYGADTTLASLIILELLSRWRFSRAFDRWQDPLLLFGAAIVGASVIQTLDFVGIMTYQWLRPGAQTPGEVALVTNAAGATPVVTGAFLSALGRWWLDCVAGTVLFVPMLVAVPPIARTLRGRQVEAAFWCIGLFGWAALLFMLDEAGGRLPFVAMALVLVVWAVVRFGVAMASIASSVCAMAATISFALQRGVLRSIGVNEGIETLWGFLLLLTVTGMFLTVLLAERNRTVRELAATAQRYRRLFAHGPHSLWVEDRATGSIIMVNDQAIRHYGYSEDEWLALRAGDLAATPASTSLFGPPREHGSIETRHRLKSGAVVVVELSYAPIDMDGRPTLLCFAVDVTERNALRRGFLEATDLERRRLGTELHLGIGRALAELEFAAQRFKQTSLAGPVDSAAIELVAQASRRAALVCRQTAHTASATGG
jgi:PAS domain S-box-containing protein